MVIRISEEEEKEGRAAEKLLEEIMAENLPNLAKDINTQIQEAEWTLNSVNPQESTSMFITVEFMNIKDEDISKKDDTIVVEENSSNDSKFPIRNWGGHKEVAHISRVLIEKNCQYRNSIPSENIPQEWRQNKSILRWRKAKRILCQQTYSKRWLREFFRQKGNNNKRKP